MDDLLGAPTSAPAAASNGPQDPMAFLASNSPPRSTGGSLSPEKGGADPFATMSPAGTRSPGFAPTGNSVKVKEWEQKNEAKMVTQAKKETDEKKTKRNSATQELQQFYNSRKQQVERCRKTNRTDEKEYKENVAKGEKVHKNPWERVISMCTDPKVPKEEKPDGPVPINVDRFKSLLNNLKVEPVPN